jgi:dihydroxyacetone kinase-like protein
MKDTLTLEDLRAILYVIRKIMEENKDHLCKLDGALGDGDLGLTMSKGFQAVTEHLKAIPDKDLGTVVMICALEMGEAVASTMGTLMSSALFRAGKATQGKTEFSSADLLVFLQAMVQGLKERGKANVGDKTILDSLVPATEAMETALQEGKSLPDAIKSAYEAAHKGALSTIDMQSKHGRAGRYLERSIGHQDPGAAVGALFLKGFSDYLQGTE